MSRNFTRGLQSTARTLIHYVGGSNPSDVIAMNGAQGPEFGLATTNILSAIEKAVRFNILSYLFRPWLISIRTLGLQMRISSTIMHHQQIRPIC